MGLTQFPGKGLGLDFGFKLVLDTFGAATNFSLEWKRIPPYLKTAWPRNILQLACQGYVSQVRWPPQASPWSRGFLHNLLPLFLYSSAPLFVLLAPHASNRSHCLFLFDFSKFSIAFHPNIPSSCAYIQNSDTSNIPALVLNLSVLLRHVLCTTDPWNTGLRRELDYCLSFGFWVIFLGPFKCHKNIWMDCPWGGSWVLLSYVNHSTRTFIQLVKGSLKSF